MLLILFGRLKNLRLLLLSLQTVQRKAIFRWPGIEPGSIAWKGTMLAIAPSTLWQFYLPLNICICLETASCTKKQNFYKNAVVRCGIRTHAHKCGPETLTEVVLKSGAFDRSVNLTLRLCPGVVFKTSPEGTTLEMKFASCKQPRQFLLIYLFEKIGQNWFCCVMASTLVFESKSPSSSLERNCDIYVDPGKEDRFFKLFL